MKKIHMFGLTLSLISTLIVFPAIAEKKYPKVRINDFSFVYAPVYGTKDKREAYTDKLSAERKEKRKNGTLHQRVSKKKLKKLISDEVCKPENNPMVNFYETNGYVCEVPMILALRWLAGLKIDGDDYGFIRVPTMSPVDGRDPAYECKRWNKKLDRNNIKQCKKVASSLYKRYYASENDSDHLKYSWLTPNIIINDYFPTGKIPNNPLLK